MSGEAEKRAAAARAAELVEDGMTVGLGTGSTVAFLLESLAARDSDIRCVATSIGTHVRAAELGLPVEEFEISDSALAQLDLAIDGTDQVSPEGWLVKGGGAALNREKIVAAAADRFVVIGDSSKPVERIVAPIPLELQHFGLRATLRHVGEVRLRDVPPSPDGGLIADYTGPVGDPAELAAWFQSIPGVVAHGLFEPALVSDVLIARGDEVEHRTIG